MRDRYPQQSGIGTQQPPKIRDWCPAVSLGSEPSADKSGIGTQLDSGIGTHIGQDHGGTDGTDVPAAAAAQSADGGSAHGGSVLFDDG